MATTSPAKHVTRTETATPAKSGGRHASSVVVLSTLVAVGALVAGVVGLFWQGPTGPDTFTTVRGEVVDLYGHGLYRNDTLLIGAGFRGTDIVTVFLGVPLLVGAVIWFQRGSLRGRLLLTGVLSYMLYVYGSMALGAAFNGLFPVYVVVFSASMFALGLTLRQIDTTDLRDRLSDHAPHRAAGIFMFACGIVTSVVWLQPLLGNMLQGNAPKLLDSYTTSVTDAIDLGIITPLAFLAGFLILRRITLGYLIAIPLIGVIELLAPSIIAATVSQLSAGVTFSTGEVVGPIAGFTILGAFAIWLFIDLLRSVRDRALV